MSAINNNHVNITNYLPTKAQVVRGVGYAATGMCHIAALGAAYIATIQVAERAKCMTGFTLNEVPFKAQIVDLDIPGTNALVPTLLAVAAFGLSRFALKVHRSMTACANTLEATPQKPIVKNSPCANTLEATPQKPIVKNAPTDTSPKDLSVDATSLDSKEPLVKVALVVSDSVRVPLVEVSLVVSDSSEVESDGGEDVEENVTDNHPLEPSVEEEVVVPGDVMLQPINEDELVLVGNVQPHVEARQE